METMRPPPGVSWPVVKLAKRAPLYPPPPNTDRFPTMRPPSV